MTILSRLRFRTLLNVSCSNTQLPLSHGSVLILTVVIVVIHVVVDSIVIFRFGSFVLGLFFEVSFLVFLRFFFVFRFLLLAKTTEKFTLKVKKENIRHRVLVCTILPNIMPAYFYSPLFCPAPRMTYQDSPPSVWGASQTRR